jgi:UDP-N-acetylglucosamine 2-epimerase (hydrolysing)
VHGDRVEALAGASVGALNNILTGHIEGGEVSGTVDESIRHAITKMSHIHFVSNEAARARLVQLGEREDTIYVIGSPDIDLMKLADLLPMAEVRQRYDFDFSEYGILMFHSVTTELQDLRRQIKLIVDEVIDSDLNYIVIYPNNDPGTDTIIAEYSRLAGNERFKVYPSLRFEYFLTLLKNAQFIIGNSSAGVREAPHFGVPTINLGSRQKNRVLCNSILNVKINDSLIKKALKDIHSITCLPQELFGDGSSDKKFYGILSSKKFWETNKQKHFIDQEIVSNKSSLECCDELPGVTENVE